MEWCGPEKAKYHELPDDRQVPHGVLDTQQFRVTRRKAQGIFFTVTDGAFSISSIPRSNMKSTVSRRGFLNAAGFTAAGLALAKVPAAQAAEQGAATIVQPPEGKRILLSCKLGMIAKEA